MALAPGTHLGPYEIKSALGAGGMGEVYRAHDTRLGRDVAIKVLPEAFASDPDRLARFEREAQILASLNHPNIAGIHGIEDAGAVRARSRRRSVFLVVPGRPMDSVRLDARERGRRVATVRRRNGPSGAPRRTSLQPVQLPVTHFDHAGRVPAGRHGRSRWRGPRSRRHTGYLRRWSGADREPIPLLQSGFAERNAELSPDGARVAYESAESGQFEVYVRPFPDVPGGKWQVSTDGGSQALWSRDGNELFFVAAAGGLMSARVERGAPLKIGTPTKVLDGSYVWTVPNFSGRLYDVTPDGRRFILLKDAGTPSQANLPTSITVVQNFDQELKRLVPAN